MYTKDGQEVEVLHKIEGGRFLVAPVRETHDGCHVQGAPMVVDAVYERAPTACFDAEVVKLKAEIEELRQQRLAIHKKLRETRLRAHKRWTKFKRLEVLQGLEDFIDGKVTHYVVGRDWRKPRIIAFTDAKCSYDKKERKLLVLFGDSKGDLVWKLNSYSDGSGSYSTVVPCLSHQEAIEKLTVLLHDTMAKVAIRDLAEHAEKQGVPLPEGYMERVENAERKAREKEIAGLRKKIEELEQAR